MLDHLTAVQQIQGNSHNGKRIAGICAIRYFLDSIRAACYAASSCRGQLSIIILRYTLMRLLTIFLLFVLYSGMIELIQPYVNRYGEWLDLAANTLGLACGLLLAEVFRRLNDHRA